MSWGPILFPQELFIVLLNSEQHAQKKFETFSFVLDKNILWKTISTQFSF